METFCYEIFVICEVDRVMHLTVALEGRGLLLWSPFNLLISIDNSPLITVHSRFVSPTVARVPAPVMTRIQSQTLNRKYLEKYDDDNSPVCGSVKFHNFAQKSKKLPE